MVRKKGELLVVNISTTTRWTLGDLARGLNCGRLKNLSLDELYVAPILTYFTRVKLGKAPEIVETEIRTPVGRKFGIPPCHLHYDDSLITDSNVVIIII